MSHAPRIHAGWGAEDRRQAVPNLAASTAELGRRPAVTVTGQLFDPKSVRHMMCELDLAGTAHPVYSPDYVLAICLCCPT